MVFGAAVTTSHFAAIVSDITSLSVPFIRHLDKKSQRIQVVVSQLWREKSAAKRGELESPAFLLPEALLGIGGLFCFFCSLSLSLPLFVFVAATP